MSSLCPLPPLAPIPHAYFTPLSINSYLYVAGARLGERTLPLIRFDEPEGTGGRQRVLIAVKSVAAAHNRLTGFKVVSKATAAAARAAEATDPTLHAELRSALAGTLPVGDDPAWLRAPRTAARLAAESEDFLATHAIDPAVIEALGLQGRVNV